MSETAPYRNNVIPFRPRGKSVPWTHDNAYPASHAHEQLSQTTAKIVRSGVLIKALSAIARFLMSQRKTTDYHALDDHILKDMGLSRHHVSFLDSKTFR